MQERITRAAVRLNDLVFTGVEHGECYNQVSYEELYGHKWEEGFMTSKGRFVDRAEAATIAYESGQLDNDPGILSSGLLIDFYKERYEPWRPTE